MNRTEAMALVHASAKAVIPGADVDAVDADSPLREQLEMDSLDFLAFVESLSKASGVYLDELDYADAETPADFAELVAARTRNS